jgi:hypothetical protein
MTQKTVTRPTEGDGEPRQESVTVNKINTTTGAKNQVNVSLFYGGRGRA